MAIAFLEIWYGADGRTIRRLYWANRWVARVLKCQSCDCGEGAVWLQI